MGTEFTDAILQPIPAPMFYISEQLNRNVFFGAGAPAGQRPGPPLHLSLFSFLVHRLLLSLLPVECRPNQCILQTWVVCKSHKELYCSRIAKNTNISVS